MKWPWVWRRDYDAVVRLLDLERKRATRRAIYHARKLKAADLPPVQPEPVAEEGAAMADLPHEVVEAIEARAGRNSRAAGMMITAASKAIQAGEAPERVAAWMWRGDGE